MKMLHGWNRCRIQEPDFGYSQSCYIRIVFVAPILTMYVQAAKCTKHDKRPLSSEIIFIMISLSSRKHDQNTHDKGVDTDPHSLATSTATSVALIPSNSSLSIRLLILDSKVRRRGEGRGLFQRLFPFFRPVDVKPPNTDETPLHILLKTPMKVCLRNISAAGSHFFFILACFLGFVVVLLPALHTSSMAHVAASDSSRAP